MDKAYTLPDLPFAPFSDLQGLVRRLIEFADLSTLPAIDDELQAQNRTATRDRLRNCWSDQAESISRRPDYRLRWWWVAKEMMQLFWVDLFGWQATVGIIQPAIRLEDEVFDSHTTVDPVPSYRAFRVSEDLTEGQWVVQDYEAVTLRPALPEEIPATAPTEEPANG